MKTNLDNFAKPILTYCVRHAIIHLTDADARARLLSHSAKPHFPHRRQRFVHSFDVNAHFATKY